MKLSEKIIKALDIFRKDPVLFTHLVNYRIKRLGPKWKRVYRGNHQIQLGDIKFNIDFDKIGSNLYSKQLLFGCYEFHLMKAMKLFLKKGGTFIDVGANIGYLTAFGANLVGENGLVVSFEPVPHLYSLLQNVAKHNPNHKIVLSNYAVGDQNTLLDMDCTSFTECGGSTVVSGFLDLNQVKKKNKITVKSIRLDDYLAENKINEISFIKIDVEGFEFSVLKGLERYFRETICRPVIVCEIAPTALKILQTSVQNIFDYMHTFGYQPFDIFDYRKKIQAKKIKQTTDIIFIHKLQLLESH